MSTTHLVPTDPPSHAKRRPLWKSTSRVSDRFFGGAPDYFPQLQAALQPAVLLDCPSGGAADEARMVILAAGRQLVTAEELHTQPPAYGYVRITAGGESAAALPAGCRRDILLPQPPPAPSRPSAPHAGDLPAGDLPAGALPAGALPVGDLSAGAFQQPSAPHSIAQSASTLQPGYTLRLAEELGRWETPRIAVSSIHGGAGATSLATLLACGFAHATGHALLVDADPQSIGLDMILGREQLPGTRIPQLSADTAHKASNAGGMWAVGESAVASEMEKELPRIPLSAEGKPQHPVAQLSLASQIEMQANPTRDNQVLRELISHANSPTVIDCGRMLPGDERWQELWGQQLPDLWVVVATANVAAVHSADNWLTRIIPHAPVGRIAVALRETEGSEGIPFELRHVLHPHPVLEVPRLPGWTENLNSGFDAIVPAPAYQLGCELLACLAGGES